MHLSVGLRVRDPPGRVLKATGACVLSLPPSRDAAQLLFPIWRSRGLCDYERQNHQPVPRVWLRQVQRPQLCGDGAGQQTTHAGWPQCKCWGTPVLGWGWMRTSQEFSGLRGGCPSASHSLTHSSLQIDPKPCTPRGMQPERTRPKEGWVRGLGAGVVGPCELMPRGRFWLCSGVWS